jgi:hypothetical protein
LVGAGANDIKVDAAECVSPMFKGYLEELELRKLERVEIKGPAAVAQFAGRAEIPKRYGRIGISVTSGPTGTIGCACSVPKIWKYVP